MTRTAVAARAPSSAAVHEERGAGAEAAPRSRAAAAEAVEATAVDALRSRLAGPTAREHVVLDFLADDLKEVRTALAAVAAYVANVEAALADGEPSQARILSLALGGRPGDRIEELATAVSSVRRRLAQVAARM